MFEEFKEYNVQNKCSRLKYTFKTAGVMLGIEVLLAWLQRQDRGSHF